MILVFPKFRLEIIDNNINIFKIYSKYLNVTNAGKRSYEQNEALASSSPCDTRCGCELHACNLVTPSRYLMDLLTRDAVSWSCLHSCTARCACSLH